MDSRRLKTTKRKPKRIDPHLLARLQASAVKKEVNKSENSGNGTSESVLEKPSSSRTTVDGVKKRKDEPKSLKDVGIHPLLLGRTPNAKSSDNNDEGDDLNGGDRKRHKKNPLSNINKRGFNLNPYFDQSETAPSKLHRRELKFNEQGKYIAKAELIRELNELQEQELNRQRELAKIGLVPNLLLGEDRYKLVAPPSLEWWDQPYLRGRDYRVLEDESKLIYLETSEDNPITHYIQFPRLPRLSKRSTDDEATIKVYLTKLELKKKRRVERLIKHKSLQENIRAGLLPPPPSKVKLKNLMSAMTHEAIKDPTLLEMKVRNEMLQRQLAHEQRNLERKLKPEERSEKVKLKQEERLDKEGIFCCIFKLTRCISNMYKVNVNASQLNLKGCVIQTEGDGAENGSNLIIVEGDYKNTNKYIKLLCQRIDWSKDREGNEIPNNRCELVAKFKELDFKFTKWSNKKFESKDEMLKYLTDFGLDNYYRLTL